MMFFSKSKGKAATVAISAGPQEIFTRAERYRLKAPIRYRQSGHMGWRRGTTLNLSKSGVLFLGESSFPTGTAIEVEISLPQKGANSDSKMLSASAVVTGHRESERGEKGTRIAAKILRCAV